MVNRDTKVIIIVEELLPSIVYGLSTASVFLYQPMTQIVNRVVRGITTRGNIILKISCLVLRLRSSHHKIAI